MLLFLLFMASLAKAITYCVSFDENMLSKCPDTADNKFTIDNFSLNVDSDLKIYYIPNEGRVYTLNLDKINTGIKYYVYGSGTDLRIKQNPSVKYLRLNQVNLMPYNDDDETIDMVGDTLYIISSTSTKPVTVKSRLFSHDESTDLFKYGAIHASFYGISLTSINSKVISKSILVDIDGYSQEMTAAGVLPKVVLSSSTLETLNTVIRNDKIVMTFGDDSDKNISINYGNIGSSLIFMCQNDNIDIDIDDSDTDTPFSILGNFTAQYINVNLNIKNKIYGVRATNSFNFEASELKANLSGDLTHVTIVLNDDINTESDTIINITTEDSELYKLSVSKPNNVIFPNPNPKLFILESRANVNIVANNITINHLSIFNDELIINSEVTTITEYINFGGGVAKMKKLQGSPTFRGCIVFLYACDEDNPPIEKSMITIDEYIGKSLNFGFNFAEGFSPTYMSLYYDLYAISKSIEKYVNSKSPIIVVNNGVDQSQFDITYEKGYTDCPGLQKDDCIYNLYFNETCVFANLTVTPFYLTPFFYLGSFTFMNAPAISELENYITPYLKSIWYIVDEIPEEGEKIVINKDFSNIDIKIAPFIASDYDIDVNVENGELINKSLSIQELNVSINLQNKLENVELVDAIVRPNLLAKNVEHLSSNLKSLNYIDLESFNELYITNSTDKLNNEINFTFTSNGWILNYIDPVNKLVNIEIPISKNGNSPIFTEQYSSNPHTINLFNDESQIIIPFKFSAPTNLNLIGKWSKYAKQNPIIINKLDKQINIQANSEIIPIKFNDDIGFAKNIIIESKYSSTTLPEPLEITPNFYPIFSSNHPKVTISELIAKDNSIFNGDVIIDKCKVNNSNLFVIDSIINYLTLSGQTTFDASNTTVHSILINFSDKMPFISNVNLQDTIITIANVIPHYDRIDNISCGNFDCNKVSVNLDDEYELKCIKNNNNQQCLQIQSPKHKSNQKLILSITIPIIILILLSVSIILFIYFRKQKEETRSQLTEKIILEI